MQPDLTISIINHSNPNMLHDCLRSLYTATHQTALDVWVVDNATDGKLVPEIQSQFPQVRWLFNKQRLGFSANHNQVLCQAQGRYVCILNDDTLIHDGAFDTLVAYMDANPKVGMAGAKLLNADGSQQNCTFRFSNLVREVIGICFLPASLCYLKERNIDPAQYQQEDRLVDWVLGACIVIRKSALNQIGLLDTVLSPIGNGEEVDWCLRAHKLGWSVAYCPSAVLTHYGGQSFIRTTVVADNVQVEFRKTSIRFVQKHSGWKKALAIRAILVLSLPWNVLILTQTFLRRRTTRDVYLGNVRTILAIAKVGISKV